MKKFLFIVPVLLAALATAQTTRKTINFDKSWKFIQQDVPGADQVNFRDDAWAKVDVPHDWSILGNYDQGNATGRGGGYLPSGIGWYRKSFSLNAADAGKRVFVEFDGVMANSEVWINGHRLGKRPYGYISFVYELTGHLNFGNGKTNILSVKADNTIQPASRYYTGAGIYRHVRLTITDPVHIDTWGLFVTTSQVSNGKAIVHVKTTVVNQSAATKKVMVNTRVERAGGTSAGGAISKLVTIAAGDTAAIVSDINLIRPELWSPAKPVLYTATATVTADGKAVDQQTTLIGIREARFDANQGFLLNGKKLMIKGVCLHHDGGAVGAAVPLRVWERRLQTLKDIGVNGIRTAHNPVAPEFLDLCDRMGFVVMDENLDTWEAKKQHAANGYGQFFKEWGLRDTKDMVLRDRNHPSIVIYSVGNEIHDKLGDSTGFKKYRDLQNIIHANDGSRPVTMALFRPNVSKVYDNGFAKLMDVVGQNYRENELVAAHTAHPEWKVIGTENGHTLTSWLALRDNEYMAGQFLWVGIDYLGEADWPNVVNGQGVLDRTGGVRPLTMQRESWWSEKPVVHIVRRQENAGGGPVVADWTPESFDTYNDARVSVYSNCEEVELFLNGKSLGSKPKPKDDSPRNWNVTFEKGTIKAIGKNGGKIVAEEQLKTAGEPARILLTIDKKSIANNWDDAAFITATLVDANGVPCPAADKVIKFSIVGAGLIRATDNADLANHETFTSPVRHTYKGKCIAIIQGKGPGKATVTATSPGLISSNVVVDVK